MVLNFYFRKPVLLLVKGFWLLILLKEAAYRFAALDINVKNMQG